MKPIYLTSFAAALTALLGAPAAAEKPIWGFQAEQLEYRFNDGEDAVVWDFDALAGTDELRFVWRSEGELGESSGEFEGLENQLRLQMPISDFFDSVVGIQASTPDGGPDRYNAVFGVKGLAPQWFEVDADLYVSDHPFFRAEAEYEALLTNRLILVPSVEMTLPFKDDTAANQGAWGPTVEIGARISYDLIDRAVSPYVGINYERAFGDTSDMLRAAGEDKDAFSVVVGTRIMF
ncbi:copper resistance protein B [Roseovarius sp. S1116L3]|uniref:Copper resistance protein B n=1 Tax=Roseovarius nanhaiticus TaxID=573024 RepID=A0A1N7EWR7_9RHOB|nr:copper resistance protein B [Roseovarius nanhaiticus]SEK65423.1 copper resistance protein B [Roseovarius nanhaiticus]SIR92395.1 copper resistance protein B [Roseovarius nanhaiticus]